MRVRCCVFYIEKNKTRVFEGVSVDIIIYEYNDKDERQKYGVIEDSNKKAERSYSPGNVLCVYSFVYSDTEKVVKKE